MNKCCICGCVKNCGPYLNKIFENMEKVGSLFDDYVIILYFDKSKDDSLLKLKQYKANQIHQVDLYVNCGKRFKYRTHNIAKARNGILKRIREKYADFQYFVMMDCDDMCSRDIHLDVLKKNLGREDWDALSFNHPTGYYDLWALSIEPFVFSFFQYNNKTLIVNYITDLIRKTPKEDLIPCFSAFNGFAIYRTPLFLSGFYDGRFRTDYIPSAMLAKQYQLSEGFDMESTQHEDCEHRHFHFQAVFGKEAKIRISPECLFV